MQRLGPQVQHYAWGSTTAIPELLGVEPDGRPWAEMWIGDHPRSPSIVLATGEPLEADLPFLLKILAAAEPLSIQTHPSLAQAQAGFERENRAGIAIDAPNRTYRDANHKPELICALTEFDALVGFRRPADIIAEYEGLESTKPILERLAGVPGQANESQRLQAAAEWLLRLPESDVAPLVAAVAAEVPLTATLHSFHPGDRGALVGLLLHRVRLEPGEAVFLGAGNLHAYISGVGVELMANSDNVVRGGLTPKHIDVDELLAVVSFDPFDPDIQPVDGPEQRYRSPGAGFTLDRVEAPKGTAFVEATGPELVAVTSGAITLTSTRHAPIPLEPGQAVYIEPGASYTARGSGVVWRASTEA